MRCSSLPLRAATLTLALATAPGFAASGVAQGRSAEDARAIERYRFTMAMLRKVLPTMYAPGTRRCEQRPPRDPMTLSLTDMTRTLEDCSPVAKALRQAGVQPRDAAILYAALLNVSRQVALRGGKTSALPPGTVRDNALLLEQNDAEIRKLTETRGQS